MKEEALKRTNTYLREKIGELTSMIEGDMVEEILTLIDENKALKEQCGQLHSDKDKNDSLMKTQIAKLNKKVSQLAVQNKGLIKAVNRGDGVDEIKRLRRELNELQWFLDEAHLDVLDDVDDEEINRLIKEYNDNK